MTEALISLLKPTVNEPTYTLCYCIRTFETIISRVVNNVLGTISIAFLSVCVPNYIIKNMPALERVLGNITISKIVNRRCRPLRGLPSSRSARDGFGLPAAQKGDFVGDHDAIGSNDSRPREFLR